MKNPDLVFICKKCKNNLFIENVFDGVKNVDN